MAVVGHITLTAIFLIHHVFSKGHFYNEWGYSLSVYLYLHSTSYHLDAYADNSSTQDSKDVNVCQMCYLSI